MLLWAVNKRWRCAGRGARVEVKGRGRIQFVSQEPRCVSQEPRCVSEGRVMLLWAVNKRW